MLRISVLATIVLSIGAPAVAQRPHASTPRAYVSVNFGTQPSTDQLNMTTTAPLNREMATVTSRFDIAGGNGVSAAVLVRAWRMLAVGAGFSNVSRPTSGTLHGSYPHPFFFNTLRTVDASVERDHRSEQAVHVNVGLIVPSRRDVSLLVFGGASFFNVKQPFAAALTFSEAYPYDTITGATPLAASQSASFTGFNAGADAAWYFTKNIGVGGGFRVLSGRSGRTDSLDLKVSSVNAGAGVRFRF